MRNPCDKCIVLAVCRAKLHVAKAEHGESLMLGLRMGVIMNDKCDIFARYYKEYDGHPVTPIEFIFGGKLWNAKKQTPVDNASVNQHV